MTSPDPEVDALVADRYLDALLAAVERHADDAASEAELDPSLREAARILHRSLVRVHPSFRFEERLARRLAEFAAAQGAPALAAGGGGALIRFPSGGRSGSPAGDADPVLDAILRGDLDPSDDEAVDRAARTGGPRRPLIVGGALTSAAISLVGVAYVAWRASRPAPPSSGALSSDAGTARARRTADALAGLTGLGGPA